MRMRKKTNLTSRMEQCSQVLIEAPEQMKGRWREGFPEYSKIFVELGCGKGTFTAGTAAENPDVLLVAVERVPDAMVMAMEKACQMELANVRFIDMDAEKIEEVFEDGEIDRIYINFPDPWPKSHDAKHRLTAPGFLRKYADVLVSGGQIHYKTGICIRRRTGIRWRWRSRHAHWWLPRCGQATLGRACSWSRARRLPTA